jgi:tRNA (guanosine-2'-O-)-methyltransferase
MNKFEKVIAQRQFNLSVILENVHDPHNIGAVMRSCDAVGIQEIFVLYTDSGLTEENIIAGKNSSSSARKWVDLHYFTDPKQCFEIVKKKYKKVFCTSFSHDAKGLYEMDLTESIALLFGNEHAGVSEEALKYCDGNFIIPQMGMVESLNISVACAVSLYEAARQRMEKNLYNINPSGSKSQRKQLLAEFIKRHELALEKRKTKNAEKNSGVINKSNQS